MVFVAVSAFLVAAVYSTSAFTAFGAISCVAAGNGIDQICLTKDKNGKYTKVEYCYVDKDEKSVCITVYQTLTGPDIPPGLRDAMSKAPGVEPELSLGEGGNNDNGNDDDSEPPNDQGSLNEDGLTTGPE